MGPTSLWRSDQNIACKCSCRWKFWSTPLTQLSEVCKKNTVQLSLMEYIYLLIHLYCTRKMTSNKRILQISNILDKVSQLPWNDYLRFILHMKCCPSIMRWCMFICNSIGCISTSFEPRPQDRSKTEYKAASIPKIPPTSATPGFPLQHP